MQHHLIRQSLRTSEIITRDGAAKCVTTLGKTRYAHAVLLQHLKYSFVLVVSALYCTSSDRSRSYLVF